MHRWKALQYCPAKLQWLADSDELEWQHLQYMDCSDGFLVYSDRCSLCWTFGEHLISDLSVPDSS